MITVEERIKKGIRSEARKIENDKTLTTTRMMTRIVESFVAHLIDRLRDRKNP